MSRSDKCSDFKPKKEPTMHIYVIEALISGKWKPMIGESYLNEKDTETSLKEWRQNHRHYKYRTCKYERKEK